MPRMLRAPAEYAPSRASSPPTGSRYQSGIMVEHGHDAPPHRRAGRGAARASRQGGPQHAAGRSLGPRRVPASGRGRRADRSPRPAGRAALRRAASPAWRVTRYLTAEQALRIARVAVGEPVRVRDVGLLEAAVHRPRASVLGQDAYPDLSAKAAALLHSLARNHPLVDGNKRLAWLATYVFLAKNGVVLDPDDDAAYELVVGVAGGEIDDVDRIAAALRSF